MELFIVRSRNFVLIPIALVLIFIIPAIISYSNLNYLKMTVNDKIATTNLIINLMSFENTSFRITLKNNRESVLTHSKVFLEKATNIKLDDPSSYIKSEFPGPEINLSQTKEEPLNSFESSPPLEELYKERAIATIEQEKLNKGTAPSVEINNRVFIYHTHSWESYISSKGEATSQTNITLVGDLLGEALSAKGIESKVDKTNISQKLKEKNWGTSRSYHVSRQIVQDVMSNNKDYKYFIDIHRDSFGKDVTTKIINDKPFAKLAFVIGQDNKQYDQNVQFAEYLHQYLESNYLGVSRGIVGKSGEGVDGVYNQDLSPNMLVIEVGGVENSLDEIKNTIRILAEAISHHYWQALEVMGRK